MAIVEIQCRRRVPRSQELSIAQHGVKLTTKFTTLAEGGEVGCSSIQVGRPKTQPSLVKATGCLLPLAICGMQAREAAKASAHALVERFEALELSRRRGAPHVVDHSAVAAAGTKEAEGNLRVIQCTDGVQEVEGRGCTLLRVGGDESRVADRCAKKFKVGLHSALTTAVKHQSWGKVGGEGGSGSSQTDGFRLVQVEV